MEAHLGVSLGAIGSVAITPTQLGELSRLRKIQALWAMWEAATSALITSRQLTSHQSKSRMLSRLLVRREEVIGVGLQRSTLLCTFSLAGFLAIHPASWPAPSGQSLGQKYPGPRQVAPPRL